MFQTLEEKAVVGLLGLLLVAGAALAVYAGFEHNEAQNARIDQLQKQYQQEQANTAAALQAASSVEAAGDAKTAARSAAHQSHAATAGRVASAVAAAPAVASTVVPESYWQAIYGSPNAK